LRERVADLESLIKVLAQKVDTDGSSASDRSPKNLVISSDLVSSAAGYEHAPIMSLFNNGLLSSAAVEEPETALQTPESDKTREDKIRSRLLAYVPSDEDIDAIWEECGYWWHVWSRMFSELGISSAHAVPTYIRKTIASGSLLALSKTLLCLALGLQQLSASFVRRRLKLPISRNDLVNHYIHTVDRYVFSDDRYCTTLEGLEVAILLTKLDGNGGRPRKAWLTYRRAISFALLQGLNRKARWQVTSAEPTLGPRRRAVFWALFQGDRYFSLILGLPYSLTDQQCDVEDIPKQNMEMRGISAEHMCRLSNLSGRLIDRYQNPDLVTLPATMKYDHELEELARTLPRLKGPKVYSTHEEFGEIYDRSMAVMHHHYIRILLHMPFMIKFGVDRRFEYSRNATIESAREMIEAYRFLRDGIHGDYCNCRTLDFSAFLACLVLVINAMAFVPMMCQSGDTVAIDRDWERVLEVKAILERAARDSDGLPGVEDSAIKTLDLLVRCKEDEECGCTRISIPYFGTITVMPQQEAIAAAEKARQQQLLTPSQTMSSAGSPSHQWQMPTPPQMLNSTINTIDNAGSLGNHCITFDPVNIPMPTGFTGTGNDMNAYNNSLMTTDWTNGFEWINTPTANLDLNLDNEWIWATGSDVRGTQPHIQNQGHLTQ
jgi:hypothetical protein